MQIIAGAYRGRKIRTTSSLDVRPCSSRVKKSLFDTLTHRIDFEAAKVLDLFAGFGSLGFESLSRGAASVTFVDRHPESLRSLRETARELALEDQLSIVDEDVPEFLCRYSGKADLVFCDPPYSWQDYNGLIESIMKDGCLNDEGFLLIEHSGRLDLTGSPNYRFHKDYGMTRVTFFQH
ncbi:MAG: 16S rRNA (guanine(966)-N(2))-methyltransferase RsmD [Candidatus Chlorobium antarcticum]|nr:16S rRNA (guanine(966)-N(2))-methyltransferase RsmD [Candidatus Chlorobium antarcticum]